MKKLIVTLLTFLFVTVTMAQKSALNSAYTHYGNEYWDKAKAAIDKAAAHPETMNDAKTWMFRGNIYLMIANNKNPRYNNLCENPLEIAYESYLKALQLDKDIHVSMRISNPLIGLKLCSDMFYNKSVEAINTQKYEEAFAYAEKAFSCNDKNADAQYLLALTSQLSGKMDIAKTNYLALVKSKTKKLEPYERLALIYKEEGDTARAINVIKRHSVLKDTGEINISYAENEAIVYSWAGMDALASEVMNKALKQDPNNYTLLVNLGSEFTNQKNYEEAESFLKKANGIRPNDYFVLYNLGNCYYNCYVDLYSKMDEIEDDNEYNKVKDSCQILLRKALPYLEQALELDGNDYNTLIMLKQIYPRIAKQEGDPDFLEKLQEIDEKLSNIRK